jgi:hypothetical protein
VAGGRAGGREVGGRRVPQTKNVLLAPARPAPGRGSTIRAAAEWQGLAGGRPRPVGPEKLPNVRRAVVRDGLRSGLTLGSQTWIWMLLCL